MGTKSSTSKVIVPRRQSRYIQISGPVSVVDSPITRTCLRTRTGVSLPNWKQRIKTGTDCSTAFSASEESVVFRQGRYYGAFASNATGPQEHIVTGLFPGLAAPTPSSFIGFEVPLDLSDVEDEANAKAIKALYKKIREVHHQFSGGLFLAELRKTVTMIRKPAVALRKLVAEQERKMKMMVKSHRSKSKTSTATDRQLQRALAGSYLEATFGWAPLLSDVKDGAIALARLNGEYRHERFRAFGKDENATYSQSFVLSGFDLPRSDVRIKGKQIVTVVYYGSFQGHKPDVKLGATAERIVDLSGFNLRDFIPTVWEVIPYSFLVDYFVNIGDMLDAASTDTSLVRRLSKVVIKEWELETSFNPNLSETAKEIAIRYGLVTGLQQAGLPGKYTAKTRAVTRTPLSSVPFLTPRFEVPSLLSRHALNIGALLAGARPASL